MNEQRFVIAAFRSRTQTLQFFKSLKDRGGDGKIINTPHEVVIGCGLSVALEPKYYDLAKSIVERSRPDAFVGFYFAQYKGARLAVELIGKRGCAI